MRRLNRSFADETIAPVLNSGRFQTEAGPLWTTGVAVLGQNRLTQCKVPNGADYDQMLTEDIIVLAGQYRRTVIVG